MVHGTSGGARSLVPEKNFAADFRAEQGPEGLRRKQNDRRCPVKLGPRILKIDVCCFWSSQKTPSPSFWILGSEVTQQIKK